MGSRIRDLGFIMLGEDKKGVGVGVGVDVDDNGDLVIFIF